MSEPTMFDQLFGQQPATSNDVASQLFANSASPSSVADQLFGSGDSVANQLFDDNNGIDVDDDGLEPDEDSGDVDELEFDEIIPEDEVLADAQESVMRQLFGSSESGSSVADQLFGQAAGPSVADQLFGQAAGPSVEDQLFGQAEANEGSVEDQLFGASAEFVEGGFEGPSPEMVIAMLSSLLAPKPVSGAPSVNITFQGPVTFNL